MRVGPLRRCEHALRHRSTDAPTKALEQLHCNRTLAFASASKARTADVLKSISDTELAQPLEPRLNAIHAEAAKRHFEAQLHAGRKLLIRDAVNILELK